MKRILSLFTCLFILLSVSSALAFNGELVRIDPLTGQRVYNVNGAEVQIPALYGDFQAVPGQERSMLPASAFSGERSPGIPGFAHQAKGLSPTTANKAHSRYSEPTLVRNGTAPAYTGMSLPGWDNRRMELLPAQQRLVVSTMHGVLIYDLESETWIYPVYGDPGANLPWYYVDHDISSRPGSDTLMSCGLLYPTEGRYAYSDPRCIWRSEDGGLTWFETTNNAAYNGNADAIALDPFQPGRVLFGSNSNLNQSDNAGQSWSIVSEGTKTWRTTPWPETITFSSTEPGLVYFGGVQEGIFRSTDHGRTWTHIWPDTVLAPGNDVWIKQIEQDAVNPALWYAVVDDNGGILWEDSFNSVPQGIYVSSDTGKTWSFKHNLHWAAYATSLVVDPSQEGRFWISGSYGLYQCDLIAGNLEVERIPVPSAWQDFEEIAIDPETNELYLSQFNGTVHKYSGGEWSNLPTPASPLYYDFCWQTVHNTLYMMTCGGFYQREMLDPLDTYHLWDTELERTTHYGYMINPNNTDQRAVCQGNWTDVLDYPESCVFVTPDGGLNWELWSTGINTIEDNVYWGHFTDPDTLLALGQFIGKTYLVCPGGQMEVGSLPAQPGSYIGYGDRAIYQGMSAGVYMTRDKGRSWSLSLDVGPEYLVCGDMQEAVLALGRNDIYYSTDQGDSWTRYQNTPGSWFLTGGVSHGQAYYVSFDDASVYTSAIETDQWIDITGNLPDSFQPTSIVPGDDFLMTSGRNTLGSPQAYFTTDMVGVESPNWQPLPSDFNLSSPYPNPFNSTVMVSVAVPRSSKVSVSIHNLLGRRVATLANGHLSPGNHTLTWDANGFSSGTYYITLSTPGQTKISRVVTLVK